MSEPVWKDVWWLEGWSSAAQGWKRLGFAPLPLEAAAKNIGRLYATSFYREFTEWRLRNTKTNETIPGDIFAC